MGRNALLLLVLLAAVSGAEAQVGGGQPASSAPSGKTDGGGPSAASPVARPDMAEAAKLATAATNEFRRQQNLRALQVDPQLARAAQYFADFMARTDRYGHAADGNEPAARAKKFGYEYCIVAENIAYQFSSAGFGTEQLATRFVTGWQNSPSHRKNMLDPNVTETAVAIGHSSNSGHYYAVQLFGRPKSQSIGFSVANRAGVAVEYTVDEQTFPLAPGVTRTHTRCQPSTLTFRGQQSNPQDGQQLTIVRESGVLQLSK